MCLYLSFKYENTFNNDMFQWFWIIFSLGAPVTCAITFVNELTINEFDFRIIWRDVQIKDGLIYNTVKPVLSGHRVKRTVAEVPKFISLLYLL